MDNIIAVLPESVANQIAAGEVIQQPASAVKELMENAMDAGATRIDVALKDGGRSLVQVSDNGKGMSADDAALCFERHATSKLRKADDLFAIQTMGFRGEALASIAAIAQVELTTRREEDELGCRIRIEGSRQEAAESVVAEKGTRIAVRNIFFNVPARRRFMGNPAKQLQAIRNEFIQIALSHPECRMSLSNDGECLFQLSAGNLRQRIVGLFGESLNKKLYPVEVETDVVKISGFIADPEAARKRGAEQYFFVNRRFIRHPYFRRAIQTVYEPLISEGMQPLFFLFLDVPADTVDVNISPTKTEVKFEHEQIIWPILQAAVRECLGKFNAVPSIDFDQTDAPVIEVYHPSETVKAPEVRYNPSYNPFAESRKPSVSGWERLYGDTPSSAEEKENRFLEQQAPYFPTAVDEETLPLTDPASDEWAAADFSALQQLFKRYIALPCGQSLLLIDQHRAEIRNRYEVICQRLSQRQSAAQTLLFPERLEIPAARKEAFLTARPHLEDLGFGFAPADGDNVDITAMPDLLQGMEPCRVVEELIECANDDPGTDGKASPMETFQQRLALKLARQCAVPYGQTLSVKAMEEICRNLLRSDNPRLTPDRKEIMLRLSMDELVRRLG